MLLLLLKIELLYNIINKKRHQKNIKIHNTTITERIKSQNLARGVAKHVCFISIGWLEENKMRPDGLFPALSFWSLLKAKCRNINFT